MPALLVRGCGGQGVRDGQACGVGGESLGKGVEGSGMLCYLYLVLPNITLILIRIRMIETPFLRQHDVTRGIFKSQKIWLQTLCGINWSANRRSED